MPTADCPFCAIDPRRILAESDLVLTLRDGFPVSPGHTLVIPRRYFADLFDATPEELATLWRALRAAADGLVRDQRIGISMPLWKVSCPFLSVSIVNCVPKVPDRP